MFVQVAPGNASARNPENPIQNKPMIPRTPPAARASLDHERLKTRPFLVAHQSPDQDSLPKSHLESDNARFGNPLCQHLLDLSRSEYRFQWQCYFARSACSRRSMVNAFRARSYISRLRAMCRWLHQGAKPSRRECLKHFTGIGDSQIPGRWILERSKRRLDCAIDRGESHEAIRRRGLFDVLRLHQVYRRSPNGSYSGRQ